MAKNISPCNHADDQEDYIDMELSSSSSSNLLFFNPTNTSTSTSPCQTREFEFQMSQNSQQRETTTSPADELFYKGKLLPLHLPPRLQMVQTLLKKETFEDDIDDKHFTFHFTTTTTTTCTPSTNTSTPLESCNISPSESCRVSSELNPDDHFFEWSNELNGFIGDDHDRRNKYWAKKLKLIKKSSLGQKLKASQAYLKSLFSKSACSDESSCAKATCINVVHVSAEGGKDCLDKYIKVTKNNNPFAQIGKGTTYPTLANVLNNIEKEKIEDVVNSSHRRSFSGAIKRHCGTKKCSSSSSSSGTSSSSSSLSFNSSGFYELQFLKRSSSSAASSEIETSIEGAIAHCKQSHKLFNSNGLCSLSASRISVSGG